MGSTFGKVEKFGMKDHCAAATGKVLARIAKTLKYDIEECDGQALLAEGDA